MSGRINGSYNTFKLKVYPEGAGSLPAASFPEAAGSPLLAQVDSQLKMLIQLPQKKKKETNLHNHLET